MNFHPNRDIVVPSSFGAQDKNKRWKQWNKNGPEGIQLARDIVQGIGDGTLSLKAPQYKSMYNKNLGVYGSFSKGSFRNNAKAALKDYMSSVAMGNSATT